MTRHRKLLLDAAQLIENNAEDLKSCATVQRIIAGKPPRTRWDSPGDRRAYERETRLARRLRELAGG